MLIYVFCVSNYLAWCASCNHHPLQRWQQQQQQYDVNANTIQLDTDSTRLQWEIIPIALSHLFLTNFTPRGCSKSCLGKVNLPMSGANRQLLPMRGSSFGPGTSVYGLTWPPSSASCWGSARVAAAAGVAATSFGSTLMADENADLLSKEFAILCPTIFFGSWFCLWGQTEKRFVSWDCLVKNSMIQVCAAWLEFTMGKLINETGF